MAILEVNHIEKHFGRTKVLRDVSFSLEEGSALAIIGSSGSGKTTLLRCLNFLERPNQGTIRVREELLFDAARKEKDSEKELRRKRLHFGLVFQSFHLFPQYTALENVMLAEKLLAQEELYRKRKKEIVVRIERHTKELLARMGLAQRMNHDPHQLSGGQQEEIMLALEKPDYKKRKKEIVAQIERHAKELLDQMGLAQRMNHYPHQLSGGQQQRVAIARALALHPDILCFDEPTSALDPELTGEVLKVIRELAQKKTTMLIVTHEMAFARDVADQVIFMDEGVIVEQGDAKQVIDHPQQERTKQFLARYNE